MKKLALAMVVLTMSATLSAQTVFNYGKNAVSKDEFVRAFNKNPNVSADRQKALKEYLDLYTNFKLKVQAAYDEGLDKDATQQYELQNFKRQIADNIINEQANVKALVKEAFERSQKEIHAAHILVEVAPGKDSADAIAAINKAYKELQEGKDFGEVSATTSTDEAVRQSQGDLGFITAFTLPYDIETVIYKLKPGAFSAPVRTKLGYHIFRNVAERKSRGSRKVAQILIAMPPGASEAQKAETARKADSIYNELKADNFAMMAGLVSNDLSTAQLKGELPEFTTGTYNSTFEDVAFGLSKPGEMSKPFATQHGYHIVKLIEAKPAPTDMNDGAVYAGIQDKVTKDGRLEKAKNELIEKKMTLIKYKAAVFKDADLFVYTDSAIDGKKTDAIKSINASTLLFSFAKQNLKVEDWIKYAKSAQLDLEGGKKTFDAAYKNFVRISADDYYRNNLSDYSDDYTHQVKEFKEANLLFGVMEKNVWGKANSDSAGLQSYYTAHKEKYVWPPSADAIIITCNSEKLATEVEEKMKAKPQDWRQITGSYGTDVVADSGRYELSQLSVVERTNFTDGLTTAAVKNQNDNTYTFNYVVKTHKEPGQRNFEDARGMVISDYQQVLEDNWIASLRRKYPVKVNEAVFGTIK